MGFGGEQSYGKGISFVLLATLGWSLSGIFVRFMPELNGFQINCWRGFWTGVSILCYLVLAYGPEGAIKSFSRIPIPAMLLSSFFFAFGSTMYVTSVTLVSVAVSSVIGATSPVFTGLLSPWMTGERPGWVAWASAILALCGVTYIAHDSLQHGNWLGMLVCLFVPSAFAMQTLTLRRYREVDMTPAIGLGGLLAFVSCGLAGFVLLPGGGFGAPWKDIGILAVMGFVQLAVPLIFYAKGAKSVPAITLSLIVMLDAVLNPLWPWLVLDIAPENAAFIGGGVIIGAVLLSIFGNQFSRKVKPAAVAP